VVGASSWTNAKLMAVGIDKDAVSRARGGVESMARRRNRRFSESAAARLEPPRRGYGCPLRIALRSVVIVVTVASICSFGDERRRCPTPGERLPAYVLSAIARPRVGSTACLASATVNSSVEATQCTRTC
jgi:hypothetical protein